LLVFNKIDQYQFKEQPETEMLTLEQKLQYLKSTYLSKEVDAVFISAGLNFNAEELRAKVYTRVREAYSLVYPHNKMPDAWAAEGEE
jgi:50S ribosomal subunit-associated GTPase HflX